MINVTNPNGERVTRVGVMLPAHAAAAFTPEEARVVREHARRMVGKRQGDVLTARAWKRVLEMFEACAQEMGSA